MLTTHTLCMKREAGAHGLRQREIYMAMFSSVFMDNGFMFQQRVFVVTVSKKSKLLLEEEMNE